MVDRDAVRRGYDDLSETYAAERAPDDREREILDRFLEPLPASARILDAGCGQGRPILRLASESAAAIGVDFSRSQLRLAASNAPAASLVQGDLTGLPIGDDAVDAVLAFHSVIHVPIDEHPTVVEEFARVLRRDGRLLLTEGPGAWSGSNSDWLGSGVEMSWDIAGADATRDHLRAAGFTVDDEWTATDELAEDDGSWVYFSARLDG